MIATSNRRCDVAVPFFHPTPHLHLAVAKEVGRGDALPGQGRFVPRQSDLTQELGQRGYRRRLAERTKRRDGLEMG